ATRMSPPSRPISRYFPRRWAPVTLRPSSLPMKCFLFGWRRMERMPVTSTALMRLPATSRSRSRRMVSTSGSSGTFVGGHAVGSCFGGQDLPGDACRRLLGLLLGAAVAGAQGPSLQHDGGGELLGVVGAVALDVVV